MGSRRVWDGGLAPPTLCLFVVGVAWVCSASVGGGGVPFPVVWGLTVLLLKFLDGGGVPASPPSKNV